MEKEKAKKIAIALMEKNRLYGWEFKFDNAKKRFGLCNYTKKIISISSVLTELHNDEQVKDTILHEIAHALMPNCHHNYLWKAMAKQIGCDGKRTYDYGVSVKKKWKGICPNCNREIYRFRRQRLSCGICSKEFNEKLLFNWKEIK